MIDTPLRLSSDLGSRLTPAELAVVGLLLTGRGNREIASSRGCSVATVKHQLVSAYRKLGIASRAHLLALAAATALSSRPSTPAYPRVVRRPPFPLG